MKVGIALEVSVPKHLVGALFTKSMMDLLKTVDVDQTDPNQGDGTRGNPYRDLNLQQWRSLAAQDAKAEPIFYLIGGRTLVRWGSNMTKLKDYISDMTEHQEILDEVLGPKDEKNVGTVLSAFSDTTTDHLAPYHKKALRLDQMTDIQAASRCRELLVNSNHNCDDCPELASSCASLFIAEANRAPKTFIISLMLLDLIQSATAYGIDGDKKYTWISMLAHSKDTDGALNEINVPGRKQGKKIALAKHPMAGLNTVKLGKDLNSWALDNASRDRVVSLMSIWTARYLIANQGGDYYLLRTAIKTGLGAQKLEIEDLDKGITARLRKQAGEALQQRKGSAALMLAGGASPRYMDLKGEMIDHR